MSLQAVADGLPVNTVSAHGGAGTAKLQEHPMGGFPTGGVGERVRRMLYLFIYLFIFLKKSLNVNPPLVAFTLKPEAGGGHRT